MVTKETLENVIREYTELRISPDQQPEPRPSDYFDIKGIVNEMFEWFKRLPSTTNVKEIKRLVRDCLTRSEELSDRDGFQRLCIYHVCIILSKIFGTFQKL